MDDKITSNNGMLFSEEQIEAVDDDLASDDEDQSIEPALKKKRQRKARTFPTCTFEDALTFATSILEQGSSIQIRRVTLFDLLGRSADSGTSVQLVADASKYGLITGNSRSEFLELTSEGYNAVAEDVSARERAKARANLAIVKIPPFKALYDQYVGNRLPSRAVLNDFLRQQDLHEELIQEALDTFLVNIKFVGLLKTMAGAERLISIEHLLEDFPEDLYTPKAIAPTESKRADHDLGKPDHVLPVKKQLEDTCFYITPIGSEGSPERRHADLFLGSLVEPALEQLGMKVTRADRIENPGMITRQIIEYLLQAKLVIVDLSFHNPNVFYELAIRHASRLPTVQIIRARDAIPFDVNQNRTVVIDDLDIYTFVPNLETYRAQIASQVRRALDDPDSVDNPIALYAPKYKFRIE